MVRMKIFVIGPQFCDSFACNIATTLGHMGHEVATHAGTRHRHDRAGKTNALWELAGKVAPALNAQLLRGLLAQLREFRPALVLFTQNLFTAVQVDAIRRAAQAPVFCWYIDPIANVRNDALFAGAYDQVFAKEPRLVETLTCKLGLRTEYLPECCNPEWHKPNELTPEQMRDYGCDIAGQGTLHPYRARFFEAFAGTNYTVRIWGSVAPSSVDGPARAWFQHRYLGETEKAFALRAAKIVVDNLNFTEYDGVNNTLFEAIGCGAFVLCDEKPTLGSLFTVDDEVVTFRSRAELLDKVRYYLSPEGELERARIRENGWRRAHRDHTYTHRLRVILNCLR
jgi:spore maturation protein CgeB